MTALGRVYSFMWADPCATFRNRVSLCLLKAVRSALFPLRAGQLGTNLEPVLHPFACAMLR